MSIEDKVQKFMEESDEKKIQETLSKMTEEIEQLQLTLAMQVLTRNKIRDYEKSQSNTVL